MPAVREASARSGRRGRKKRLEDEAAALDGAAAGERTAPRYPINSVDNALKLLLMLRERELIRVAEASETLGVVRSTAHRLLAMLQYRGFVQQDPDTKAYRAGPAMIEIGLSVVRQLDIRHHLRPYLERLSEEVGETVQLITLEGASAVFIDSVESPKALRTSSRIGSSYPAHTTSGGKALLAELTPARLAELYPSEKILQATPRSISSRSELLRELARVRARGYGTNRAESEDDIAAVAVVVRNAFGQARAAIAVSAPVFRLDESMEPEVAEILKRIAVDAASQLA